MQAHKNRLEDEPAFVLHSYPFRETSLIVEVFSRQHGRAAAGGARCAPAEIGGARAADEFPAAVLKLVRQA